MIDTNVAYANGGTHESQETLINLAEELKQILVDSDALSKYKFNSKHRILIVYI